MFGICRCHYRQYGIVVIRLGLKEFVKAARDILFPLPCIGCGAGLPPGREISLCPACRQDVRLLLQPFCTRCGMPFDHAAGENHLCSRCLSGGWHFRQARAVVQYRPPVTAAVKNFKYRGKMHGLATFAALTEQYFERQTLKPPDVVIPVPLHPKRLRQRGFNQALVLCRKLLPDWQHIIDPHVLVRHHWIRPQTGLNGAERRRNVRNAFRVRRAGHIRDKKILLVDDVFTTGATVNECARVLMKNRAAGVDVFTFARVVD